MEELEEIIKQAYNTWGSETVGAILKEIDTQKIFWRGTLKRSISYNQKAIDQIEFVIAAPADKYAEFIDGGTGIFGPKKTPIPKTSIPGIAYYIKPWADSKGLNNWAVATNIVKRGGIKPKPFYSSVIANRIERLGIAVQSAIEKGLEETINRQSD